MLVTSRAEVIATRRVGAFRHLSLVAADIADIAKPGQFVSAGVGCDASALVGRRPLPIANASPSGTYGGTLEVLVDSDGDAGMRWLAERRAHDEVDLIGPIGRPFPLPASAVDSVNWPPVSCMPSPESPAKRMTTRSRAWECFLLT